MNEQMKEVWSRIDAVALKLGQTAYALWPHALRYLVIKGICLAVIMIVLEASFLFLVIHGWRDCQENNWCEGPGAVILIVGSFGLFFSSLFTICNAPDAISCIFEPIGYMTMQVLGRQ